MSEERQAWVAEKLRDLEERLESHMGLHSMAAEAITAKSRAIRALATRLDVLESIVSDHEKRIGRVVEGVDLTTEAGIAGDPAPDEELERLQRELKRLRIAASDVMGLLEEHGPAIVPHLLDADDNPGARLRRLLADASPTEDDAGEESLSFEEFEDHVDEPSVTQTVEGKPHRADPLPELGTEGSNPSAEAFDLPRPRSIMGHQVIAPPFTMEGETYAIVRWAGEPWLVWKHPDGQWVTKTRIDVPEFLGHALRGAQVQEDSGA